jgi:hypothetical protein
VNFSLKLGILVLQKVACHLIAENVIVEAFTLLSDILRPHLRYLKVHGTWVLGWE